MTCCYYDILIMISFFHCYHVLATSGFFIDIIYNGRDVYVFVYICLPNPSTKTGCDTGLAFKQSLTGLNLVFLLLDQ